MPLAQGFITAAAPSEALLEQWPGAMTRWLGEMPPPSDHFSLRMEVRQSNNKNLDDFRIEIEMVIIDLVYT